MRKHLTSHLYSVIQERLGDQNSETAMSRKMNMQGKNSKHASSFQLKLRICKRIVKIFVSKPHRSFATQQKRGISKESKRKLQMCKGTKQLTLS